MSWDQGIKVAAAGAASIRTGTRIINYHGNFYHYIYGLRFDVFILKTFVGIVNNPSPILLSQWNNETKAQEGKFKYLEFELNWIELKYLSALSYI